MPIFISWSLSLILTNKNIIPDPARLRCGLLRFVDKKPPITACRRAGKGGKSLYGIGNSPMYKDGENPIKAFSGVIIRNIYNKYLI
jgi:hypothetical protein